MRRKLAIASLAVATSLPTLAAERIVVLTPDVADIVVALKAEKEVIGRDQMAKNPELASAKVIGLSRSLTVEPITALKPTLVIGSGMAQPPGIYAKLKQVGLRTEEIAQHEDGRDYIAGMCRIGELIGKPQQAAQLAERWQAAMQPAKQTGIRYLLSYDGRQVAGRNTAGDALIRAAGGINAAANIDGFKQLNREAWLTAKPDVVIVASHTKPVYGGLAALKARTEVATSPAGKSGKVFELPANQFLRLGTDSPSNARRLAELAR
ncbi:ABC transporter substrate-binding protein [Neisseriaceae bacterium JH1-16]|nr:ABC transporter substrate-binding protein [Neisseriaceae bacterium JH1-16]